jgi:hypothetical protein
LTDAPIHLESMDAFHLVEGAFLATNRVSLIQKPTVH